MTPVRIQALDAAGVAVASRPDSYGAPEQNFTRVASMWSVYTGHQLDACDVAAMMVLFKVARLQGDISHPDTWVDIAGYAACGAEVSGARIGNVP